MTIKIREGLKNDLPQVLNLIKELADYEKSISEVTITLKDLEKDGFGKQKWYRFLVAEKKKRNYWIIFFLYSLFNLERKILIS